MANATKNSIERYITLADGRQLGFTEYGDYHGEPVIFCHGTPGSRLSIFNDMSKAAATRNLRVIAPDRPGYGLSTFTERHSLLDWVKDLEQLTDALDIYHYKMIGFSMGSLAAYAATFALPEKITKIAIVGSLAPLEIDGVMEGLSQASRDLFALARTDKDALATAFSSIAPNATALFAAMVAGMCEADKFFLNAHQQNFETDFAATLASGVQGMVTDFVLTANPWDFSPAQIKCAVDLWVGSEDCNTPPAMTRHMISTLANNRVFKLAGAGHSCLYTHWEAILNKLVEMDFE